MKGKALFVFAVILVMAWVSCKKNTVSSPGPQGTATDSPTITMTKTVTLSPTISPTFSVSPTFTNTSTITPTFTITQTFTITMTPTNTPGALIDDFADCVNGNYWGGYWITYDDNGPVNNGTSYVWPMSQTWATRWGLTLPPFEMSTPGYTGTGCAARVTGYVTTNATATKPPFESSTGYTYGFMGMGTQLVAGAGEPTCYETDISRFTGVKFWAKGDGYPIASSSGASGWEFKVPFTTTANNNCDESDYTKPSSFTGSDEWNYVFSAPTTWTQFTIPFSTLTQFGWGSTADVAGKRLWNGCTRTTPGNTPGLPADAASGCPISVVLKHAKQLQFQSVGQTDVYPANPRELWIGEINFY
jgi:hypothetical protein